MNAIFIHDRREIEMYCRRDIYLHIYSLGDLDDFFWPYTTWYGLKEGDEIRTLILLYAGIELPAFLALSRDTGPLEELIGSIIHLLPTRFYAHLSPGTEEVFRKRYRTEPHGRYIKMALEDTRPLAGIDCTRAVRLREDDLDEIVRFYDESYPGHWFDPRMLVTGQYFAVREANRMISAAGIHVYSEKYGVATLGNIATHPAARNRGCGTIVTAKLCRSLLEKVDHVGLNVRTDNRSAIFCYEKLGFRTAASYGEYLFEMR